MSKRYTIEEVKKIFKDGGCELLETEYVGSKTLMKYRCDCGNSDCKITFSKFKNGGRCMECSGKKKHTIKEVQKYFKDHDCKLLATEYENCNALMEYECECGNSECKISFGDFKRGQRCMECGIKKRAKKQSLLYKDVYKYFKDHGCILKATEYINNHTLMEYECDCGNTDCKISFGNFQQGRRCKICAIKKMSGKNNPSYNPNLTDEEREKGRICPGLGKWKKDVREKDNHTCQYCGETEGKLCAHHIENYANNKELRTVLSNGFLFCKEHHIEFHKKYGYDCNREQLNEFLKIGVKNE